jgi:FkbM family methyltransferase
MINKTYAQNNEDLIVFNYLTKMGLTTGSVLDIGANDGKTFSNSRYFSKRNWEVYLVEPSPKAIQRIKEEYLEEPYNLYQYAIGTEAGKVKFFESGSLINKNDVALVSTFDHNEKLRWPKMNYEETLVDVITFKELIDKIGKTYFDFISIDAEGFDLKILKQINFKAIGCRALCVEWNGRGEFMYWAWVKQFGFRLLSKNGENLIFVR